MSHLCHYNEIGECAHCLEEHTKKKIDRLLGVINGRAELISIDGSVVYIRHSNERIS